MDTPSKDVMLVDIANTKKELEAYKQIVEGFEILQSLPENKPCTYRFEIVVFGTSARDCEKFYNRLLSLYHEHYGDVIESEK